MRYLVALFAFLGGCDGGSCRCVGDVPEGHVELSCGESVCLMGAGYRCSAKDEATATGACTTPTTASGPQAVCQRYMSCVAKAEPDAFPSALQAYGDQSPCWNTSPMAADLCGQSCQSGLERSQAFAAQSRDCGCQSNAECKNPDLPYCDLDTGVCVVCTSDAHCPSGTVCSHDPSADAATPVCLTCDWDTNRGCSGAQPVCDWQTDKAVCVECLQNQDCRVGYCNYTACEDRCSAVAQCMFNVLNDPAQSVDCGTRCANGQAYAQCVYQNCKTECTYWDSWTNLGCETCRNQKCGTASCSPAGSTEFNVLCTL
jgi:Cys-rich repeat protein